MNHEYRNDCIALINKLKNKELDYVSIFQRLHYSKYIDDYYGWDIQYNDDGKVIGLFKTLDYKYIGFEMDFDGPHILIKLHFQPISMSLIRPPQKHKVTITDIDFSELLNNYEEKIDYKVLKENLEYLLT